MGKYLELIHYSLAFPFGGALDLIVCGVFLNLSKKNIYSFSFLRKSVKKLKMVSGSIINLLSFNILAHTLRSKEKFKNSK